MPSTSSCFRTCCCSISACPTWMATRCSRPCRRPSASRRRPPSCPLEGKVTETTVMTDLEAALQRLQQLADLGGSIAIDDFGTGPSSLAYLRRMPVDTIKIDRSFLPPPCWRMPRAMCGGGAREAKPEISLMPQRWHDRVARERWARGRGPLHGSQ
ncbi:EAL domain-containing protein [Halomonas urmiana]|uniref:EAL domain-containing protein n=1 Tax=Halomonas urmiana TaxID=490901 RepID=A0A5R8MKY2_9GAMM|nr:EAL domain-containing protein [Halomonas urmiana]